MNAKQGFLFDLPEASERPHRFAPVKNRVWTQQKAKLISRYLHLFVLITKHGTYIDGFAGPQYENEIESWTAKLVVESKPQWLKSFFLCDLSDSQFERLKGLVASQPIKPKRAFSVYRGNFNEQVTEVLKSTKIREGVATFCLLDQRTFECDWATVDALARAKRKEKIELMYFVPSGWLERTV